jgi:microcin C transport system substrate-binding protein
MKDLRIRRGLAHAMNMDAVIERVFRRRMSRLTSYMEGYGELTLSEQPPSFDENKAKAFFAEAGYNRKGDDGILRNDHGDPLRITLTYADGSRMMDHVCSVLVEEAKKCGLDLRLDPLSYSVCSRKVYEKRHQICLWAWPLETPFPKLYNTFLSALAYDGRGHTINNTNNIFSIADPELDEALRKERLSGNMSELKEALHHIQKRLNELSIWIPGWKETYTHVSCWRWICWPESPTRFCPSGIYDPVESHLYWIDPQKKEETVNAKRAGKGFEEKEVFVEDVP